MNPDLSNAVSEELRGYLAELGVQEVQCSKDAIILKAVPLPSPSHFNQGFANVLCRSLGPWSRSLLLCVDASLDYCGEDPGLQRAFARRDRVVNNGWQGLFMESCGVEAALRKALRALGADGSAPILVSRLPVASPAQPGEASGCGEGLLAKYGLDMNDAWASGTGEAPATVVGNTDGLVLDVLTCLCSRDAGRCAVLVGESGVGKTCLAWATAKSAMDRGLGLDFVSVSLPKLFAGTLFESEREGLFLQLLDEVADLEGDHSVLVLERVDLTVSLVPNGHLHLARVLDAGVRILGTTLPDIAPGFSSPRLLELERRIQFFQVREPTHIETVRILEAVMSQVSDYHGLNPLDASLAPICVAASRNLPFEGVWPGKAVKLLELVASRAALVGTDIIGGDDIYRAAGLLEQGGRVTQADDDA